MSQKMFLNSLFSCVTLFAVLLVTDIKAETLTNEQQKALGGAIQELTDPSKREAAIKNDPKAVKSDQMVKEVGGEYSEEIYQLAGKVMESLASEAGGDPEKMEKILEKAQKNPEAFANTFSDEQKRMLNQLSKKIEQSKKDKKTLP